MARHFITQREINFINDRTKELIQRVVGEEVIYYAISLEKTSSHRLYGEAVKKTWQAPVRINALVLYENDSVSSTNFTLDSKYRLEVYFHAQELLERNVSPREGDFVEYGEIFYEITQVTQPQVVFGQVNNKVMKKCTCVPSREGQFQAGGKDDEGVDNSHPIENSQTINR